MRLALALLACFTFLNGCGGGGGSATKPDPVVKTPVNNPPVANADTFNIGMNVDSALDVLGNDNDSDALTISALTNPLNGTLVNNDTDISYRPNQGYVGSDNFSYTIKDTAGQESSAVVSLNIANLPPVAENDVATTAQNMPVIIDILSNDVSEGGHELTIASTSSPSQGVVSHDGKILTYTPAEGFAGNDSFVYVVRDSFGDETTASVGITIENIVPIANDDALSFPQNTEQIIDVLANDIDAEGDLLELVSVDVASYGEAVIEEKKVSYKPDNGFSGNETITYTLIDTYGATSQGSLILEVTNITPTATNDIDDVLKNRTLTIDVLVNDLDVEGDELTIQSVSTPQHGSANIVEGKVEYKPNTDYVGEDVFGYTVIDSYGASDSGFITVTVQNSIQLKGKLVGYDKADLTVSVSVGNIETQAITDENGEFTIDVDLADQTALVIATVENVTTSYSMHAYFGDVASLMTEMDQETFIIENKNITDVTTAEYELLHFIRTQESQAIPISSKSDLTEARLLIDTDIILELAISTNLILSNNSIDLPAEYTNINDFMKTPFAIQKQLSIWREENSTQYYDAYNKLFNNQDLTSEPNELNNVNNILQGSNTTSRPHYSDNLYLSSDMTGEFIGGNHTWSISSGKLILNYDEPSEILSKDRYCGSNDNHRVGFSVDNTQIKQLYSTEEYKVYILKNEGEFSDSDCLDSSINTFEYNTFISKNIKFFQLSSMDFYFSSFRKSLGNTDLDYDRVGARFNLEGNGDFVETIDSVLPQRTGTWQLNDNTLQLAYDDGVVVALEKNASYRGLDIVSAYVMSEGKIVALTESFFVPKQDITWSKTTGNLRYSEFPMFNNNLKSGFGFKFLDDNTGAQQSSNSEGWYDNSAVYSWSLENNLYKFDYYVNPDTYEFMSYCDVNEESCEHWRRREVEIVGVLGNQFIAKVYQEMEYPEGWGGGIFKSGYLALFDFSEL